MIGRADIEESKSFVVTNTQLSQANYPYNNFTNTSVNNLLFQGSFRYAFTTKNHEQPCIIVKKYNIIFSGKCSK